MHYIILILFFKKFFSLTYFLKKHARHLISRILYGILFPATGFYNVLLICYILLRKLKASSTIIDIYILNSTNFSFIIQVRYYGNNRDIYDTLTNAILRRKSLMRVSSK